MLVRIVRMEFREEKVQDFKKLFNETYSRIRNFEGCRFLELYTDNQTPHCFYTMSKWENEDRLEEYRNSTLFRDTWAITKSYFSAPPMAYSLLKNLPAGRHGVEDLTNPF